MDDDEAYVYEAPRDVEGRLVEVGGTYHVDIDDCCAKGRFVAAVTAVIAGRVLGGRITFANGVELDSDGSWRAITFAKWPQQ